MGLTSQIVDLDAEFERWVGEFLKWGVGWTEGELRRVWNLATRAAGRVGVGKVREVMARMKEAGVGWNEHTFAALIHVMIPEGGDRASDIVAEMEKEGISMTEVTGWKVADAFSADGRPNMVWKVTRSFIIQGEAEGNVEVVRRVVRAWLAKGNGGEAEKVVRNYETFVSKRNPPPPNTACHRHHNNPYSDPTMYHDIANFYALRGESHDAFRVLALLPIKLYNSYTISIALNALLHSQTPINLSEVLALYRWARDGEVPDYQKWMPMTHFRKILKRVEYGGEKARESLLSPSAGSLVVDAVGRWAEGRKHWEKRFVWFVWREVLVGRRVGELLAERGVEPPSRPVSRVPSRAESIRDDVSEASSTFSRRSSRAGSVASSRSVSRQSLGGGGRMTPTRLSVSNLGASVSLPPLPTGPTVIPAPAPAPTLASRGPITGSGRVRRPARPGSAGSVASSRDSRRSSVGSAR
ncbi:hypothetical protein HK097_004285 [Rhizophlyctis rosea]|uniref:Pentatricopeptide repeat-containing protein n=1 Tax=Rhizophlyctis rosea TaxID=64517 RepID=A0AAD5S2J2_9FUNG|nr:hypothetical protein HK097_004285 [Rhizophlyctis rosea]